MGNIRIPKRDIDIRIDYGGPDVTVEHTDLGVLGGAYTSAIVIDGVTHLCQCKKTEIDGARNPPQERYDRTIKFVTEKCKDHYSLWGE